MRLARRDTPEVTIIASGDLRLSANQTCWPEQESVEAAVARAIRSNGHDIVRGHPVDTNKGHGFIDSQKYGREVFQGIHPESPIVVVFAAWQYSHHVLAGLMRHKGPILTVANWSGTWPGLVGMLNLNGSLAKAGVPYDTLWSEDFTDDYFGRQLSRWLSGKKVMEEKSYAVPLEQVDESRFSSARAEGEQIARKINDRISIMGVFDEGCMGMYNAIIPDHLLNQVGMFKERLSQSALYYETLQVTDEEASSCLAWVQERGMSFNFGTDEATELTVVQVLQQFKTYIAALRIADDFGCDTIGIQYQQGLKDLLPASDLVEGLLNNTERPPVLSRDGSRELYAGRALVHFNEVDECAGLDAYITSIIWRSLGYPPETTLHDVRWGDQYDDSFVWVFQISGAAPPAHFIGGYSGTTSERQPPMYFPLGGGTVKGISKPGHIIWSRIYVEDGRLKADLGLGEVLALPDEETERRWQSTTHQWPIMHAIIQGVSRREFMARHKANHIQVVYVPDSGKSDETLMTKAAAFAELGIETFICGMEWT
ncbi:MAG: fucose isomerase [Rhodothermaceae bacterium]|nr:fucose isomerase [Rhodothermaceae bacterium]MYD19458.1 fucose isomerase [Rhodothermaceae bacterium]MYD56386.1 fucose isomerase [Rhodothermaceae bacterium]MYI43353.1 fucose isomerase [Rhodothermaceae bacterium]MYJ56818.1 fucose isomerase [Rhodothermaceae bacterium]